MTFPLPPRPGGDYKSLLPSGAFAVKADLRAQIRGAREANGRFTSLRVQYRQAHFEMGRQCARQIAAVLDERIKGTGRPQRETQILLRALRSPKMVDANGTEGFVVGPQGYLDSTGAAKYWRALEVGSRVHVGDEIGGFFVTPGGKSVGPSRARFRRDVRLIQLGRVFKTEHAPDNRGTPSNPIPLSNFTRTDKNGHVRLRAVKASADKESRFGNAKRNGTTPKNDFGHRIVISNPIPAYHYFLIGGQRYLESGHIKQTYERVLGPYGLKFT